MTAVTLTELSVSDIPINNVYGTAPKRRAIVFIRYTSTGSSDTLALATYVSGIADIEGILSDSMNSAVAATAVTWSTTTMTAAGHTGAGLGEVSFLVNFN